MILKIGEQRPMQRGDDQLETSWAQPSPQGLLSNFKMTETSRGDKSLGTRLSFVRVNKERVKKHISVRLKLALYY